MERIYRKQLVRIAGLARARDRIVASPGITYMWDDSIRIPRSFRQLINKSYSPETKA